MLACQQLGWLWPNCSSLGSLRVISSGKRYVLTCSGALGPLGTRLSCFEGSQDVGRAACW